MSWPLRARRTNQPPRFLRLTPLSAHGYGRERDVVAKDRRITGPTGEQVPLQCLLNGGRSAMSQVQVPELGRKLRLLRQHSRERRSTACRRL